MNLPNMSLLFLFSSQCSLSVKFIRVVLLQYQNMQAVCEKWWEYQPCFNKERQKCRYVFSYIYIHTHTYSWLLPVPGPVCNLISETSKQISVTFCVGFYTKSFWVSTIDQGWSRCWGRLRPSPAIYIYIQQFLGEFNFSIYPCSVVFSMLKSDLMNFLFIIKPLIYFINFSLFY
jgi:hypothetical protein